MDINLSKKDIDRFWSKVRKTDQCWLWTGTKGEQGYGVFRHGGKNLRAHRVSYYIEHGQLTDGMVVRHKCDNPPCVRPSHLIEGTHAENVADRDERQRQARGDTHMSRTSPESLRRGDNHPSRMYPELRPRGEENTASKMTTEKVIELRRRRRSGETVARLGRDFHISKSQAAKIANGDMWRHIP